MDGVAKVLWGWGMASARTELLRARSNIHWRVTLPDGQRLVLRRYRSGQSAESIDWELSVLRHLHARGWPVAAPVDGPAWFDGAAFVLFPFLSGSPSPSDGLPARDRGQLLASLHLEFAALARPGQRPGWQRSDEVARAAVGSLTTSATGRDRRDWPAALLLSHARRIEVTLDSPPDPDRLGLVHGDLHAANVLYHEGELTGVLDFDSTHVDLLAADVACARRSGNDEVVRGYLDVAALTDAELSALDDLWRVAVLRYAVHLATGPGPAEPVEFDWCVRQLEKTRPYDG